MPALVEKAHKLHGRTTWRGFDVSIENKPGSIRRGTDRNGNEWATKHKHAYGYLRKTQGADGDHLDCFLGPDEKARHAYIVTINHPHNGKVDEQKVFLNFSSQADALESFRTHYDDPDKFFRSIVAVPAAKFEKKAESTFDNPRLLRAAVREVLFEEGLRRFREATKRPTIFYARPLQRYSTHAETADLRYLKKRFPDHEIVMSQSRNHARGGMESFFKQIDEADMVIVRPRAKQHVTSGTRAEVVHALNRNIPVFHLRQGRLSRVGKIKAGTGNHKGNFASVVFKRGK